MRIVAAELYRYAVAFRGGPELMRGAAREGLLLRLSDTRGSAWGEAAPLPGRSLETVEEAEVELKSLLDSLLGMALPRFESELARVAPGGAMVPSASFCLEQAFASLAARAADLPVAGWLRSEARTSIGVNALLSGDPDEATRMARRRLSEGFRAFKLKVGRASPNETRSLVRSVRGVIGSGTVLRLDANQAWEFDEAAATLVELEDLDIAYVEEPLREPAALAQLSLQTSVPLALDESVAELARRGLEPGDFSFARAAILKPTLLGGIHRVLRLAEAFARAGIDPVITSSFESAIGLFGLAAVAAACPGSQQAAGLDTLRFLETGLIRGESKPFGPVLETDRSPSELGVDRARLERVY